MPSFEQRKPIIMRSDLSKFFSLSTQHTQTHLETHMDSNESGEKKKYQNIHSGYE